MSSVRMCDGCGVIFSENEEGWSSTNGGIQRRRDNGARFTEQVNVDLCAACTSGDKRPAPRLPAPAALTAATAGSSDAEQDLDHFRIAELERQLTELRYPGAQLDAVPGTATRPALVTITGTLTDPEGAAG